MGGYTNTRERQFMTGDTVKVTNWGQTYTTLDSEAKVMKLNGYKHGRSTDLYTEKGVAYANGTICTVVSTSGSYAGIQVNSNGNQYVISQEGIELTNWFQPQAFTAQDFSNMNYTTTISSANMGCPCGVFNNNYKPKKSIMKKLSNFIKKSVDGNTQELLKAGLINGDLEPTYEGDRELKQIQWFANLDALVARAKEINTEAEAEAKK
jgi:hypothetical protein